MTYLYKAVAYRQRAVLPKIAVYAREKTRAVTELLQQLRMAIVSETVYRLLCGEPLPLCREVYGADYAMVELCELPGEFREEVRIERLM